MALFIETLILLLITYAIGVFVAWLAWGKNRAID
jgi:hypothetical protein